MEEEVGRESQTEAPNDLGSHLSSLLSPFCLPSTLSMTLEGPPPFFPWLQPRSSVLTDMTSPSGVLYKQSKALLQVLRPPPH